MEIGAAVKAIVMSIPWSVKWLNLPWPLHCLIVINLLESHYLGTVITDDCDSEAVKAGYIFKTFEEMLYIFIFAGPLQTIILSLSVHASPPLIF